MPRIILYKQLIVFESHIESHSMSLGEGREESLSLEKDVAVRQIVELSASSLFYF